VIALAMLEGALILLAGILAGRLLPGRRKGPRLPESPKPVCGCGHHYAMHDPKTGECNVAVKGAPVKWDRWDNPIKWEMTGCACLRYTGPEPLPSYYAPEIAGEEGDPVA
jgi:hypothetical protein